jgi:hypothetical protein
MTRVFLSLNSLEAVLVTRQVALVHHLLLCLYLNRLEALLVTRQVELGLFLFLILWKGGNFLTREEVTTPMGGISVSDLASD